MKIDRAIISRNRSLLLAALALVGALLLIFVLEAYWSHKALYKNAVNETENQTLVLEQYINSTIKQVDLIIDHASEIIHLQNQKNTFDPKSTSILLKNYIISDFLFDEMTLTNEHGEYLASSSWITKVGYQHHPHNIKEQSFFKSPKFHSDNEALFISEPSRSPQNNQQLVLAISKKIWNEKNKAHQFLIVFLKLKVFSDFFYNLNPGSSGTASLWSLDYKLLARYPYREDLFGKTYVMPHDLAEPLRQGEALGSYISKSSIDQIKRIFTYKVISNTNMFVEVSKAERDIYQAWQIQHIGIFIGLVLFCSLIALFLIRHLLAAQQYEEQHAILIQSAKLSSLGEMAASIVHEINNPIAVIQLYSEQIINTLKRPDFEPEKINSYANKTLVTIQRVTKIIKGLKKFSRQGSAQEPFVLMPLAPIIESAHDLVRERYKTENVALTIQINPELKIYCRETQIAQVIVNLLGNAIDAISGLEEKWVKIEAQETDQFYRLTITDCGHGISSDLAAKIMQPFFTTKGVEKGTGLGLSISNTIITDHGGKLWIDHENKNTCFVIDLPKTPPDNEAEPKDSDLIES